MKEQISSIYCTSLLFHPQTDDGTGVAETCLFFKFKSLVRFIKNVCMLLIDKILPITVDAIFWFNLPENNYYFIPCIECS